MNQGIRTPCLKDSAALKPSDLSKFLSEVLQALSYDIDVEEEEPGDVVSFQTAHKDAEDMHLSSAVLEEARKYYLHIAPDWLIESRAVNDRWHRVFAAHGMLKRYVKPMFHTGRLPPTIAVNGVRYERL